MSWLSKIRTKQESLRFRDSAGVPADVLSSLMKKKTAPAMQRKESTPYIMVIFRIPSDGNQFFFLSLDTYWYRFENCFHEIFLPELHLGPDIECDIEGHVDHHDGKNVARDARLTLIQDELRHAEVNLKRIKSTDDTLYKQNSPQ